MSKTSLLSHLPNKNHGVVKEGAMFSSITINQALLNKTLALLLVTFWCVTLTQGEADSTQRDVVIEVLTSLGVSFNLEEDESECIIEGVNCDDNDIVNEMSFPSSNLEGELSYRIGELTDLESLYLYQNNIGGTIPTEIGMLTSLEVLNMYTNQLTGTIPTEIAGLTALKTLTFTNNKLCGTIPTEIQSLGELETLGLRNNKLSGTIPSEIGAMDSLGSLYIMHNKIKGRVPNEVCDVPDLFLSVDDNICECDEYCIKLFNGFNLEQLVYWYITIVNFTNDPPPY